MLTEQELIEYGFVLDEIQNKYSSDTGIKQEIKKFLYDDWFEIMMKTYTHSEGQWTKFKTSFIRVGHEFQTMEDVSAFYFLLSKKEL